MAGFTINQVAISGNLTRNPELRTTPGGLDICQIGVAVNERVKDQGGNWGDRVNFFDVTVFGGQGKWLSQNMSKGDGIAIAGRLRWEQWEAKDGSGKRSRVSITADSAVPITRGGNGGGGGNRGGGGGYQSDVPSDMNYGGGASTTPPPTSTADDEIPF